MKNKLSTLTPEEKRVAAKVLVEEGHSTRTVEQWLGISDTTVLRAKSEPTPDELKQFEADFKMGIDRLKKQGIALVHTRIIELIPRERRIDQLVKAGEYLEGKSSENVGRPIQINTQVNVDKYVEE